MNNRITCTVENCFYNEHRLCSADEIKVNNDVTVKKEVTKCAQTECATFTLK